MLTRKGRWSSGKKTWLSKHIPAFHDNSAARVLVWMQRSHEPLGSGHRTNITTWFRNSALAKTRPGRFLVGRDSSINGVWPMAARTEGAIVMFMNGMINGL